MFCGLDKFDGPILEGDVYTMGGGTGGGAYIQDVNWVTYFGGLQGGLYTGGVLTGFCGIS